MNTQALALLTREAVEPRRTDVLVVGPDIVGTDAIARSLAAAALSARRASPAEAAEAIEAGELAAVVLVAGPGIDTSKVLSALMKRPSTVFIVVAATASAPPMVSDLRPIVVSTLGDLLNTVFSHVRSSGPARGLTDRHVEILQQLALGCTPNEAADELGITVKTFNNHLGVIYRRLGARNVTQAVLMGIRQGLIRLP